MLSYVKETEKFCYLNRMSCCLGQNRERFSERIGNVADKVEHCDVHISHGGGSSVGGYMVADTSTKPKEESALTKATHGR